MFLQWFINSLLRKPRSTVSQDSHPHWSVQTNTWHHLASNLGFYHLVGGLEHVLFFHILGMSSSPTDELIFFRGLGIPPTRFYHILPCLIQDIQNDVESFESFRLCFMSTVRIFSHSGCDGMQHKLWPKTLGNSWFDWDRHLLLLTVSIEILMNCSCLKNHVNPRSGETPPKHSGWLCSQHVGEAQAAWLKSEPSCRRSLVSANNSDLNSCVNTIRTTLWCVYMSWIYHNHNHLYLPITIQRFEFFGWGCLPVP